MLAWHVLPISQYKNSSAAGGGASPIDRADGAWPDFPWISQWGPPPWLRVTAPTHRRAIWRRHRHRSNDVCVSAIGLQPQSCNRECDGSCNVLALTASPLLSSSRVVQRWPPRGNCMPSISVFTEDTTISYSPRTVAYRGVFRKYVNHCQYIARY